MHLDKNSNEFIFSRIADLTKNMDKSYHSKHILILQKACEKKLMAELTGLQYISKVQKRCFRSKKSLQGYKL
jgi:hypothetical protein